MLNKPRTSLEAIKELGFISIFLKILYFFIVAEIKFKILEFVKLSCYAVITNLIKKPLFEGLLEITKKSSRFELILESLTSNISCEDFRR